MPGKTNTLHWLSGSGDEAGDATVGQVAIDIWSVDDGWQPVQGGVAVVNSGTFEWRAPVGLTQAPLLRVRAMDEPGLEHITQMMLA